MPLYDFKCTVCGEIEEDLVPSDITFIHCTKCGEIADRQETYRPVSIGLPNGFHTMRTKQK
jgi:putative FmdB family regulatory protein